MSDEAKTKEELLKELRKLRAKLRELEEGESGVEKTDKVQGPSENRNIDNMDRGSAMSPRHERGFGKIIGKSPAMQEVYDMIEKAGASDANVAIYGESGTGKELVAHAIHELSSRRGNAFVPVNCGAIPETLLESEFFGFKKGAFTGASMDKHGYLDLADGGTLFLDEVGELSLNMQAKLLRALDRRSYFPVGCSKSKMSDFRIIAATNRDLAGEINEGLMRKDFFYRIHVIPITLPPLRNRKEDIPLLVDHFLGEQGGGKEVAAIPRKILEALCNYYWPGNVRELQNVLHRYLTVKRLDFMKPKSSDTHLSANALVAGGDKLEHINLRHAVEDLEKRFISKALEQARWNRTKAAMILGISRRALFRKMANFEMM